MECQSTASSVQCLSTREAQEDWRCELRRCERALFSHAAKPGNVPWIGAVCTQFRHPHIRKTRRTILRPAGRRGSHKITPEKPKRALWEGMALNRGHNSTKKTERRQNETCDGREKEARNCGLPVAATFWVNASSVIPPLTITNVKNPSICILSLRRKKKN